MKKIAVFLSLFLWLAAEPVCADDAMQYFNLGIKSSMTREKIAYFTKALQLNPGLVDAYRKRGLLHYFQGNYDKVIQDYQSYLDLAPDNAEAYLMIGIGFLESGMYQPAINNFTQAIEIEPQFTRAFANRAEAYRRSGKGYEAIMDSTRAIQLRGDLRSKADAYRTRARVYREIGSAQLAVEDTRAAVQIDPRIPSFWRYYLNYASPEEMRSVAPFFIIAIALVLIFGLRLKPPDKED
jgi:tetratricopeptide (TPR) repeat protein